MSQPKQTEQANWGTMKTDNKRAALQQTPNPKLVATRREIEARLEQRIFDRANEDFGEIFSPKPWVNELDGKNKSVGY